MIKSMTWFKRRPGLTVEQFSDYWRGPHAALGVQLPGLRHYRQNRMAEGAYAKGREPMFDGLAETWFDDTDAMRAVARTEQYGTLMADEPNLMDMTTRLEMIVDEHVIIDNPEPAGGYKFMTLVKRRPDLEVDAFQSYWRDHHGPLAARNATIVRYVQNHLRRRAYDSGRNPAWDGVAVTWFATLEDMRASASSPELALTRADEANFLADAGVGLPFFVAREQVIPLP